MFMWSFGPLSSHDLGFADPCSGPNQDGLSGLLLFSIVSLDPYLSPNVEFIGLIARPGRYPRIGLVSFKEGG